MSTDDEFLPGYHRVDLGSEEAVAWALERELRQPRVVLRLEMDGEPVSKSRARFTGKGSKTRAYTPEKTRQAEERIGWLAREAGAKGGPDDSSAFGLFAKFFCGTWQRRDVDNMLKLVSDALTGLVWADDSQVSEVAGAVERGDDNPRTHVLVYQTTASLGPTKPCEVCGTKVRQYKSQPNRFCSRACRDESQRESVEITCACCDTVMVVKRSLVERGKPKRYCSRSCESGHKTITFTCDGCGQEATKPQSQVKRGGSTRAFCTDDCRARYWREHRKVAARGTCDDCGGPTSKRSYRRCMACAIEAKRGSQ